MLSKLKLVSSSSNMLSKSKIYKDIWHLVNQTKPNMCKGDIRSISGVYNMLCHSFCTLTESPQVDDSPDINESPELPAWVKFSEKEDPFIKNSDEDFVLPSISYWIENHKARDQKVDVKSEGSDTVDNDVDKISKILKIKFESPDSVVQALNGCGVTVSESLVEQMLKRFSSQWIPAFGFFKWAKLLKNFKHSPNLYNLMVDNLGKSKKFDLMWELVKEMDQLEGCFTLVTISKVMRRLARAGRYSDAIEAFRSMEQYGVNKDVAAMNALMDALVKEQSVEHAQDVYIEFKNHIPPNLQTFNILIHGWCKARRIEKARETMEEMKKHGFSPDVVTYTSVIEAYCHDKDFRKVDDVLEEMREKGFSPNLVTFTIIMHARGKAKEINEALKVYEKMKENPCVPDASFYSSLIHILGKAGRLKDAHEVFEDMPKQGVAPNVLTYNTMISIATQHSQEENALKLLQKMEATHCKPDLDTYAPLLKMCCKLKRMKVLSFLLNHMFRNNISIELGTYSLLVRGLCKSGQLEHACSFFEDAVVKGFVPRDHIYNMLVKELERKGMGKAKERIEELMLKAKKQGSSHSTWKPVPIDDKSSDAL